MGDGDFGVEAARRRDWAALDDDLQDASTAGRADEGTVRADDEPAADDTYTRWLPGLRDSCTAYDHAGHDFDACVVDWNPGGLAAETRPSALFLKEKPGAPAIEPSDVQQYRLGDCALLATAASLASTPAGRATLHDAIRELKDPAGNVVGYSVRLYEVQGGRFGPKTFTPRSIPVSAFSPYVVGHARANGDGSHYEIWPLVLEKAYAHLRGGYDVVTKGELARDAIEALTGAEARHTTAAGACDGQLAADLRAGQAVVLSSKPGAQGNPYGIIGEHAYAVTGIEERAGQKVVLLYNPWGHDHPVPIPCSELGRWFESVDASTAKGAL